MRAARAKKNRAEIALASSPNGYELQLGHSVVQQVWRKVAKYKQARLGYLFDVLDERKRILAVGNRMRFGTNTGPATTAARGLDHIDMYNPSHGVAAATRAPVVA
jgi:hypothetical protein